MKKTHRIVMLPTEDKVSSVGKYTDTGKLVYNTPKDIPRGEMQHLYILSDDEIKEGDWFMSAFYSYPIHNTKKWREKQESMVKRSSDCSDLKYHKIIATTDPKLNRYIENYRGEGVDEIFPQIPQSLIEYYAEHQPEEVELEYEHPTYEDWLANGASPVGNWKPKLQNNEVVWVEPRSKLLSEYMTGQKIYTREEVEKLRDLANAIIVPAQDILPETYNEELDDYFNWLKENL